MDRPFAVRFSYKGHSITTDNDVSKQTTATALLAKVRTLFQTDEDVILRLIFKGKTIAQETLEGEDAINRSNGNDRPAFLDGMQIPKSGTAKVIVMGSATAAAVRTLNSRRSDPLMRGFGDEKSSRTAAAAPLSTFWGPGHGEQHTQYKFCRFQECADASFGARPGASTPHAWEARTLLERLATDPGIVAVLTSRELVVGTLGEIDPIDDRLVQHKQREGGCVLGYNTNHGLRIDVKLRTEDLGGFRPYWELAATLVHELSHNWVGEHNAVFWTNHGQMRVEYLWRHARLMRGGAFARGKRTAALAEVTDMIIPNSGNKVAGGSKNAAIPSEAQTMDNICQSVRQELATDMAQHGLPAQLVMPAVLAFSKELMTETQDDADLNVGGLRLGTSSSTSDQNNDATNAGVTVRERALAAAEKRARDAKDKAG